MELNFFAPEVTADPYPFYAEARRAGPVVRNDFLGVWMVTGYDELVTVLRDHERFSATAQVALGTVGAFMLGSTMSCSDPPEHTRLRSLAQRAVTPRAVNALEPAMRSFVAGILESRPEGSEFELLEEYAFPLSTMVFCEFLGVPVSDREKFKDWSDGLLAGSNLIPTPEQTERGEKAGYALQAYFEALIEQRRSHPTDDDLVGRLVAANSGGTLSDKELMATCILMLVAGIETTAKLITNSLLCLALHPDQRLRLLADPELMGPAIEECLRFVGPPQAWLRVATTDLVLGGVEVKKDENLLVMGACGNRDERQFPDAERFDIGRSPNNHLTFSSGAHHCIGASLSRLEARVAIERLLAKAPNYRLARPDEPLEYAEGFFMRGVKQLPIRLDR